MDAHALLTSQGWRGTGNSLHPTTNTIGLSKPLLVARKDNKNGLGKKKHQTSDMWWMQAFDQSLKALDTSKQSTSEKTTTPVRGLDAVRRGAGKWVLANGGLYASFIKGDGLAGSFTPPVTIISEEKVTMISDEVTGKAVRRKVVKNTKGATKTVAKNEDKTKLKCRRLKGTKRNSETKEERKARKAARRLLRKQQSPTSLLLAEKDNSKSMDLAIEKGKKNVLVDTSSMKISVDEIDGASKRLERKKKR